MWSAVVKFMLWWQCRLPAQTSSPCWGSEQQVSFQHGGNRLTMTSSLPGSLPPLLFFSVVPLFFPPLSHISYVSVKAEKSLTSWVPEMKLVGGRSGGTSPCAPPPPSHSAFVQGRGEERHTEVKIKRNTCLGWSHRGTMQDLTPADGEAPRNAENFWLLLECRNRKAA